MDDVNFPINNKTEDQVLSCMRKFGGGFIEALAFLYVKADLTNRQILRNGFKHYFEHYAHDSWYDETGKLK